MSANIPALLANINGGVAQGRTYVGPSEGTGRRLNLSIKYISPFFTISVLSQLN